MTLRSLAFLVCALSGCSDCSIADRSGATDAQARETYRQLGDAWLENAKTCRVGRYEVMVPAEDNGNDAPLRIYRDGKPVLQRDAGSTSLFDPNAEHADETHPIVYVWHGSEDRDVERVWYQTVPDRDGRYVMTYDQDFDGQPDSRTTWQGHEIVQAEVWFEGKWVPIKGKSIELGGRRVQVEFKGGLWRVAEDEAAK